MYYYPFLIFFLKKGISFLLKYFSSPKPVPLSKFNIGYFLKHIRATATGSKIKKDGVKLCVQGPYQGLEEHS